MRVFLVVALSVLFLSCEANAQVCTGGCGCQGNVGSSGWRILTTRTHKCLSCKALHQCGEKMKNCRFEACKHLHLIACPEHIPRGQCGLK
jgi:hypothetical protein